MSSTIQDAIDKAKRFLKNYAIARSTSTSAEAPQFLLYLALPVEAQSQSDYDQPLCCVVRYCTAILEEVRKGVQSQKNGPKYDFGSVDAKAIEFLVEVVVHAVTRPILSTGFGPTTRAVLSDLNNLQPLSTAETEYQYSFITSLINVHSEIFAALHRSELLALLIAGAVELVFKPDTVRMTESIYNKLITSIEPSRLLPSIQLLLTRTCPDWARSVLSKEMTKVLLQPRGLLVTTAFILRPDHRGEVPLERFDTLAALVSAKPSTLTETEYMNILAPQIFDLVREKSAMTQRQHRAAAAILRQLCTKYDSAIIIIDELWKPLIPTSHEDGLDVNIAEALTLLSDLTAFEYLRKPILYDHVSDFMRLGYHFHHDKKFDFRDQVERLLYRLTASHDNVDLLPACNLLLTSVMDIHGVRSASSSGIDQQLLASDSVKYILRIAKQIAANGQASRLLQWRLISSYADDVKIAVRAAYLELMMELPSQNHKCYFDSADAALFWADRATIFFESSMVAERSDKNMDELSIIYLNMLKLLTEEEPNFTPEHVERLEKLVLALKNYTGSQAQVNTIAMTIQQKLEITVLSIRSSNQEKSRIDDSIDSESNFAQRYAAAIKDMSDDMVPNRAHGLYMIGELAKSGAELEMMQLNRLLPVMMGLLGDEEGFVHHNAIKALRKLHDVYGEPFRDMLLKCRKDNSYSMTTRDRIDTAMKPVESS